MTEKDVHYQRNKDVYGSDVEIKAHEDHFYMQGPKFEVLHSLVKTVDQKAKIADVGCMTGIGSVTYKDLEGVEEVHVIDGSEKLLEHASKKGLIPHQWVGGDQKAPIEDGTFDMVIASDIIEHIVNTDSFIEELKRMVEPGGYLLLSMPNLGWWINRWRLLFGKVPVSFPGVSSSFKSEELIDLNHIRINLTSEWKAFFEHHGLEVKEIRGYRLVISMKWFLRPIDKLITDPSKTFGACFLMKVKS